MGKLFTLASLHRCIETYSIAFARRRVCIYYSLLNVCVSPYLDLIVKLLFLRAGGDVL